MNVPSPPRQKVCKVFETDTLSLDFGFELVDLGDWGKVRGFAMCLFFADGFCQVFWSGLPIFQWSPKGSSVRPMRQAIWPTRAVDSEGGPYKRLQL